MFEKFNSLKPEKQERIINAAITEFANKGYSNAATDEIVKQANISKGALFHYFTNKKELFLFLYDYTLNTIMNNFFGEICFDEKDILVRIRQAVYLECMLVSRYPMMFDFVKTVYFENSDMVKEEMQKRNAKILTDSYNKLLSDFDKSKFKEEININQAVQVIMWTVEGILAKEKEKLKLRSSSEINLEEIMLQVDDFLELLRNSFYR
ncbi:TetR/AcrR family transcriptional regulator [Paenibacillus rigui]|uniref:TetR family transcriptional regulator n=1 Tax=Paenibacillus rigui TaxID=554312 RepID=A0A229UHL7_9BACL|nr:TetR/AcrR family transcriptional regulator [Paenibacillus rigui]OXM82785.1 TetR family transcriptional regulator [Paenibacillus rigui]